jgi:lipopolysaccharide/colanic/teichoic acid biosynthesis glycosyltransferase
MNPTGQEISNRSVTLNFSFYQRYGKAAFDIALAFIGLLACALPMAVIGILLALLDGYPVLFRQIRIGRKGKGFQIVKFRTMRCSSKKGSDITVLGDHRITQFGAFLRRFKLDELPQLFNVLRGEMSFVGPRPDVPGYVDQLKGTERAVLALRPGITGLATLVFANEEEILAAVEDPEKYNNDVIFPEKTRINLLYMRDMTLMGDIKLIFRTVLGRYF